MLKTTVKQSTLPGAGFGLFALEDCEKKTLVASLSEDHFQKLSASSWDKEHKLFKVPFDTAILFKRSAYRDVTWKKETIPTWYRMNHGKARANVKMHLIVNPRGRVIAIEWRNVSPIKAGDELFFNYGDVPKEWN